MSGSDSRVGGRGPAAIRVLPARSADLAACALLVVAHRGGSVEEWCRGLARDLDEPERLLVVAAVEETVVGYGRAALFQQPDEAPSNIAPSGYYLNGLVVAPPHRRKGLGLALTIERMRWVSARADEVWYFANARNRASLELHRRLGFQEVTRDFSFPLVQFKGGVGVLCRADLRH